MEKDMRYLNNRKDVVEEEKRRNKKLTADNRKLKILIFRHKILDYILVSVILGLVVFIGYHLYQYKVMEDKYTTMRENYTSIQNSYDEMSDTAAKSLKISKKLDRSNAKLVKSNKQLRKVVNEYEKREELHNNFGFAVTGKNDLSYDKVETLDQMLKKYKVNDTQLILAWIMTESGGMEKATNSQSTAKGYGQILDGTAKFVYTKLLGKSGYYNGIALDGNTNMEIMVAYINYLYDHNGHNLLKTIDSYRGLHDPDYIKKINSYLPGDKTVYSIDSALKSAANK